MLETTPPYRGRTVTPRLDRDVQFASAAERNREEEFPVVATAGRGRREESFKPYVYARNVGVEAGNDPDEPADCPMVVDGTLEEHHQPTPLSRLGFTPFRRARG